MHYPIPYPYTNRLNTLLEGYTLSPLKSGLDNGVHYIRTYFASGKTVVPKPLKEPLEHTKNYDVFICHSSEDKDFIINNILPDFKNNGISYWIDNEQIKYGDRITNKITDGLRNSKSILVCLSKNSANSDWIQTEYGAALHKNIKILPTKKLSL
ncbi:toll/interleukin-1 receptor domain-containing protein [Candidatus Magnetomonas plexicatena]|uniref:toll/interleukin-1 receptor domain-containing protein n=1 Tax=Candidatus Magnetomonas plexicatena TaxID=2552947 RepID=UPI001C76D0CC|nr:toll/interleukin-1 receptor domain-containing protein [Nitrospirales bacterium LBB_01]